MSIWFIDWLPDRISAKVHTRNKICSSPEDKGDLACYSRYERFLSVYDEIPGAKMETEDAGGVA